MVDWLAEHFGMLMPEEVILALKLTKGNVFVPRAMTYLTTQLNEMEMQEASKLFFALTQKRGALSLKDSKGNPNLSTYQFLALMGSYFSANIERFDDASMAFLLSMLANNPPNLGIYPEQPGSDSNMGL